MSASFDSPYYPYSKAPNANNMLRGAERIPKQILTYLLDLPSADGYQPSDDNERPRVRLAKYLYYDTGDPLSEPMPTPKQKLSMLYDPTHPAINTDAEKAAHPVGYRMYWQHVVKQSIIEEKTFLKCYVGRVFSPRPNFTTLGIQMEIWVGSGFETTMYTDAESRSFAIEQAVTEALAPINMTGIGAFSFLRRDHADNGSRPIYATDGSVLGRAVHFSVNWTDGTDGTIDGFCREC